ncbi:MAG: hypothetical protein IPI15_16685 [Saprospiraceae bacterium]|uniref:hypothetical protein n=1 Tax=Candidatus Brachybacter algidus TaxID=2982024 RepID=UPI00257ACCA3|nr:hypothetical protein [Candidatus Brachybacter algidus]MBK7605176.1 hypothetical protein [Candidatus Brachybacter algidus]
MKLANFIIIQHTVSNGCRYLDLLTLILASDVYSGHKCYTHGTHITVAHTMGATIGINSFLCWPLHLIF